jgi:hypothetical protein
VYVADERPEELMVDVLNEVEKPVVVTEVVVVVEVVLVEVKLVKTDEEVAPASITILVAPRSPVFPCTVTV